ncbi:MAG: methylenetetrahydrofolate reductase [NAD(P)H] [Planctomycetales bacterium]|nr:methylenetetrahydrofolate reductase [NAD(P)H] [Planctomycetales bacterium]
MSLASVYEPGKSTLSFELFPPKTDAGVDSLWKNVEQLMEFKPSYITCTYGAGGSTREKTLDIVCEAKRRFQLPVASHLTCVGSTADDLRNYLSEARDRGVDAIVALRGDPPQGQDSFQLTPGGLRYANELVQLIQGEFPTFGIAVAGYPETHQEAASPDADLENLKRKVDQGGQVVITQLFFDNRDFFRFQQRCRDIGIHCPIVPGILPVTNLAQIQRITSLCGAKLPEDFVAEMGRNESDAWQHDVGVAFAQRQVAELLEAQVPGIHFYVLNRSPATAAVLRAVS